MPQLIRAVRFLAGEAGIDQFLDIGTGLPTMQNTHEVAQSVVPHAQIVYVDNDPLVLAHARVLLVNTTPKGVTTYIDADYREPDTIIADARNVLNFQRPVTVMFMGVLGYVPDAEEAGSANRPAIRPIRSSRRPRHRAGSMLWPAATARSSGLHTSPA